MDDLHELVTKTLINRVADDECSTGDLLASIKFLKDNGITVAIKDESQLEKLKKKVEGKVLPFNIEQSEALG